MADFYPMPPDVRKRIEKWLKEHEDEVGSSDDVPSVVVNEGSGFTASLLEKLAPRRLSPTASAALAAKPEATEKLRRADEECTACRRDNERMEDVGQDI